MKLEKLLERMDYKVLAGSTDIEISTLVYDSRKVEKASVFVCISGAVSDAHDFIPDVVKKVQRQWLSKRCDSYRRGDIY